MFDHLSIGVRDLKSAARFYDALFAPLGHEKTWEQENELAYGSGETRVFWLYPVGGERIAGLGAHIAFRAEGAAEVDKAYRAAIAHGATTVRAAGLHLYIGPDYYVVIVLDPDGNKIEIVVGAMH